MIPKEMMTYQDLIKTFTELINNENIHKEGLILFYELDDENHKKMDEHLFYKVNERDAKFEHRDIIEVEIEGFTIRIVKEGWKLIHKDLVDSK
jgi:hypothetical protein